MDVKRAVRVWSERTPSSSTGTRDESAKNCSCVSPGLTWCRKGALGCREQRMSDDKELAVVQAQPEKRGAH